MAKKDDIIHLRVNSNEKKIWEDYVEEKNVFSNLAQLIRYAVREIIEKEEKRNNNYEFKNKIANIDNKINSIADMRKGFLKEMKEFMIKQSELTKEKTNTDFKEGILNLLKEKPMTSETIAKILPISENEAIDILNKYIEGNLVKLNKDLTYEVISHE